MEQEINAYNVDVKQELTNTDINDNLFSNIDFGPLKQYLDDDNITDISYSNNGQVWLKSLDKGVYRVDNPGIDNDLMEKIAFQCANIMGKVFNMASPFLDSESAELRMNFVHDSIARNGIAAVFRKTPAKIRLKKDKLLQEKYITNGIHDFLIKCVKGHCNIMVAGETGSGKTELVKYLASHTIENEKLITIEDTLELHLDRIFPHRDIVAMKTNNIASYSDVLVTCMRQNPKWILLSEVRSAEAVTAVRNSISSGHNVLSTIHADKAQSIPHRMYSLLESNIDVEQFMTTIYRYIQLGLYVRARYDKERGFMRELAEVTEFYVDENNKPKFNVIYHKNVDGTEKTNEPSKYLIEYLANQGVDLNDDSLVEEIDYDALDDLAKADQKLEAEKLEKKEEEAYIANFGEDPVEEEVKDTGPKVEPQIDFSKLNQTPKVEEKKEEPASEGPKVTEEDVNSFIEAMKKAKETSAPAIPEVNEPAIEPTAAPSEVPVTTPEPVAQPVVASVPVPTEQAQVPAPAVAPVVQEVAIPSVAQSAPSEVPVTTPVVASVPAPIEQVQTQAPAVAPVVPVAQAPTVVPAPVPTEQVQAPVPAVAPAVAPATQEFSYDNNLYSYDYSATAPAAQPASNPLDIEKTQYLDPVNPNVGSPNNA